LVTSHKDGKHKTEKYVKNSFGIPKKTFWKVQGKTKLHIVIVHDLIT
jgi:hypothetical protein